MTVSEIKIAIVAYPEVMQSAFYGLKEIFLLANDLNEQSDGGQRFSVDIYDIASVQQAMSKTENDKQKSQLGIIIIPPSMEGEYYLAPEQVLKNWILLHHSMGAIVCSVCAGAFILADCGLLHDRPATTHWGLAFLLAEKFPAVQVDINKILVNDGDIITAAGLMSWVDLGLELVAQFMHPNIMRKLGKNLIVDTGPREQRYYQSFYPKLDHGDQAILKAQHYLQRHFHEPITMAILSEISILTGRTFLRRFVKATGLKPMEYIQKLRIQKACNLIESSNKTFEAISLKVGYEDASAFRKTFLKIIGLTPREFKSRFATRQT